MNDGQTTYAPNISIQERNRNGTGFLREKSNLSVALVQARGSDPGRIFYRQDEASEKNVSGLYFSL